MTRCIACGYYRTRPIYNPGPQPLAALNLPTSEPAATNALRYPLNFYQCCKCGHVFNVDFEAAKIPYETDNNLMYNSGNGWRIHLMKLVDVISRELTGPAFWNGMHIDIGAGDGQFLELVRDEGFRRGESCSSQRLIAFEPGNASKDCCDRHLETLRDYFIPERDFKLFNPDVMYLRHVLEHLEAPLDFMADIVYWIKQYKLKSPLLVCEVPNIEPALSTGRVSDFLYEHISHFTPSSFKAMTDAAGWKTRQLLRMYNDEVIVWIGEPDLSRETQLVHEAADIFGENYLSSYDALHWLLDSMDLEGAQVAYWGGTGKSASFLNTYNLNDGRVVDSDLAKVGKFVPGTGQLIEHSTALLETPVDVIVITTRWRAADIYSEIKTRGIQYKHLLIVDGGSVRDYSEEDYVAETP